MIMRYDIWMHELKGISNREKRMLLAQFGTAKEVLFAQRLDLPEQIARRWLMTEEEKRQGLEAADRLWLENKKRGIQTVTICDPRYRDAAKKLDTASILLYYLGTLPEPQWRVTAVVGTRKATPYGIRATEYVVREYLIREYAGKDGIIASSLSPGIDTAAHQFAAAAGGASLGFVPHGLDQCFVGATSKITEKILTSSGAIISPFSVRTPQLKHHFFVRNELFCSWSDEILMVEGDGKSGAVAIGRMGLRYGKPVRAVPNSIFSDSSAGCHQLMLDGAKPFVLNASSIGEYKSKTGKCRSRSSSTSPAGYRGNPISALLQQFPMTLEELAEKMDWTIDQIQQELVDLEFADQVRFQTDGKWHYTGW